MAGFQDIAVIGRCDPAGPGHLGIAKGTGSKVSEGRSIDGGVVDRATAAYGEAAG